MKSRGGRVALALLLLLLVGGLTSLAYASPPDPAWIRGIYDDADYDELSFRAKAGDMFVFFSDGILDASNKAEELFGRERVGEIVAANPNASADEVVKLIFKAVAEHASGEEAFDDQTVVAIRVKGTPGKRK